MTSLVGGDRGHGFALMQPPRRPLEHDAPPQRCRRLTRQAAHLPGEVELRGVAAARHVADVGVVGVDDRIEQFP